MRRIERLRTTAARMKKDNRMSTTTQPTRDPPAVAADCSGVEIKHSLAADDSCQMQLYAKGHIDAAEFLPACRRYLKSWDGRGFKLNGPIKRTYWRAVPAPSDNIVCDVLFHECAKGRGAYPVTILDIWLPLHRTLISLH